MTAFFHFAKQSLDDVTGTDILPVLFWKAVEGQACVRVGVVTLSSHTFHHFHMPELDDALASGLTMQIDGISNRS